MRTSTVRPELPTCTTGGNHGIGEVVELLQGSWPELALGCEGEIPMIEGATSCSCGSTLIHLWELSWRDGPGMRAVADTLAGTANLAGEVLEFARTRLLLPCGASLFLVRELTMKRIAQAVLNMSRESTTWRENLAGEDTTLLWRALQEELAQERAITPSLELASTLLLDAAQVAAGSLMRSTGQVTAVLRTAAKTDLEALEKSVAQLLI